MGVPAHGSHRAPSRGYRGTYFVRAVTTLVATFALVTPGRAGLFEEKTSGFAGVSVARPTGFEPVTFGSVDALEAFCTALSCLVRGYESR